MVCCTFFVQLAAADSKGPSIRASTKTQIEVNSVKNILHNATGSSSVIRIGEVRNSDIQSYDAKLSVDQVSSILDGAANSRSNINIGTVSGTRSGNVHMKVEAKNVQNKIVGGTNNHASTHIGVLENTSLHGSAVIEVKVGHVRNIIERGNNNEAEVSIGYDPASEKSYGTSRQTQTIPTMRPTASTNAPGKSPAEAQKDPKKSGIYFGDKTNKAAMLDLVNGATGGCFAIDNENKLALRSKCTPKGRYSKEFRAKFIKYVNNQDVPINLHFVSKYLQCSKGKCVEMYETPGRGSAHYADAKGHGFNVFIGGSGTDKLPDKSLPAAVLIHELNHHVFPTITNDQRKDSEIMDETNRYIQEGPGIPEAYKSYWIGPLKDIHGAKLQEKGEKWTQLAP